jgi:hypothetical protein
MDIIRGNGGIYLKRNAFRPQYSRPSQKKVKRSINPPKTIMFLGGGAIKTKTQTGHARGFDLFSQRGGN